MFRVEDIHQEATVQTISVNGNQVTVELLKEVGRDPLELLVRVEDKIFRITVERGNENGIPIRLNGKRFSASFGVGEGAGRAKRVQQVEGPIIVTAPMSGRIASLKVEVGGRTEEGQPLIILEAMKMENEIACPKRGIVKEVYVQAGALVKAGDKLALVE
jgi:biotin carboxyl carrier protein